MRVRVDERSKRKREIMREGSEGGRERGKEREGRGWEVGGTLVVTY